MKRIVQIELTNHCSRCCEYCGKVNMKREKGFITIPTILSSIAVLKELKQTSVGLNHYGESLMHPDFIQIVELLNSENIIPWLYTNGDLLTDGLIAKIAKVKMEKLVISGHAPKERRIELHQKCVTAGINTQWQSTVADHALSIANQVTFANPLDKNAPPLQDPAHHCRFLKEQYGIVLWNGDLVPCCFDYDGKAVFGNIRDGGGANPRVSSLCATCPGHPGNVV